MENELKPKPGSSGVGEIDAKILPRHDGFRYGKRSCNVPGSVYNVVALVWCVEMRLDCDLCCKCMNEKKLRVVCSLSC